MEVRGAAPRGPVEKGGAADVALLGDGRSA